MNKLKRRPAYTLRVAMWMLPIYEEALRTGKNQLIKFTDTKLSPITLLQYCRESFTFLCKEDIGDEKLQQRIRKLRGQTKWKAKEDGAILEFTYESVPYHPQEHQSSSQLDWLEKINQFLQSDEEILTIPNLKLSAEDIKRVHEFFKDSGIDYQVNENQIKALK